MIEACCELTPGQYDGKRWIGYHALIGHYASDGTPMGDVQPQYFEVKDSVRLAVVNDHARGGTVKFLLPMFGDETANDPNGAASVPQSNNCAADVLRFRQQDRNIQSRECDNAFRDEPEADCAEANPHSDDSICTHSDAPLER